MIKINLAALGGLLGRASGQRGYSEAMPSFLLDGVTYDYVAAPKPERLHLIKSWEYPHWPRVEAQVPLADGGTVSVYGEASRWGAEKIHVRWADDEGHFHGAWLPQANVRRLTPSEWDIIEYWACPENLRHVQWGKRLPGFLPE